MNNTTILLPVHLSNTPLANECLNHLLNNSELNIILIDDCGRDDLYVQNSRIKFIHNTHTERQPLVKIWNQCIKECPTENIILAAWRQRPSRETFDIIEKKLKEGYGSVFFDGLHFFGFNKYLTSVIGFFDEGFLRGQFEDTDWINRHRMANIAIYSDDIPEQRFINGTYVHTTWGDGWEINKNYYDSKWIEDASTHTLTQLKNEVNIEDRKIYQDLTKLNYLPFEKSILTPNLNNYFNNVFTNCVKNF